MFQYCTIQKYTGMSPDRKTTVRLTLF
jgi:hypothetical protein